MRITNNFNDSSAAAFFLLLLILILLITAIAFGGYFLFKAYIA